MISVGEVSSDNNIFDESSGNFWFTSCPNSAVETHNNEFVSLSDSITPSGKPSSAEIANSSESGGAEDGDKIFNTSIFVSSDASSSFETFESFATCFTISKVSVPE